VTAPSGEGAEVPIGGDSGGRKALSLRDLQTDLVSDPDHAYAEWFVWAKREVSPDRAVCLAAAQAAVAALAEGRDRRAAEEAARRSPFGLGVMLLAQVSPRRRAYAEWYDWARREVGGGEERWHAATRAAVEALERGASSAEAAEQARASAAQLPDEPAQEAAPPAPSTPEAPATEPPPERSQFGPAGDFGPLPSPPARPHQMYGGFWRRLVAGIIDGVVLAIPCLIMLVALSEVPGVIDNLGPPLLGFTIFWVVMVWWYFAGLESSSLQATLGKVVLGIVVTDLRGRRISFLRASARVWLKFLFSAVTLLLVIVDAVVLVLNPRKRSLHDLWSGTLVAQRDYVPLIAHQAEEQRLRRLTPPPAYQGPFSPAEG
jgi:uncharacterized RDD family membrane protein YckC